MQQSSSWLSYKGVSALPLLMTVPLLLLGLSDHWSYDESMTYMNILDSSPLEIIKYEKYRLANNHVLNSLYFRWMEDLGAKSLFLFRLPNFLMFFVYFLLISRLLKRQEGYQLRHIDQLMLYLWPYYIYFAQARGYSLAMVAMLGALIALKNFVKDGKPRHLLYIVLLGSISSVSIFSFIFPFAAMLIVAGLYRFSQVIKKPLYWLIFALSLPVAWYVFDKGQVVSEFDPAIIGRDTLFRGGTLSSLISFLTLNEFAPREVFLVLKILVSASLVPVAFLLIKHGKVYIELTVALVSVLLLVVAHYAFGAMYPLYRGAAYIIILVLLAFVYSNFKKSIFNTLHFATIIVCGLLYMGYLFYFQAQKSMDDVLVTVAADPGPVLIQDVHPAPVAVNHMRYADALDLDVCITYDSVCFDRTLETAKYVICFEDRIALAGREDEFELQYRVATFFYYNKYFYKRK
ncbi:MAG TPA: hypothetical protein VIN07_07675 [Flavipsychrobacter sp.]